MKEDQDQKLARGALRFIDEGCHAHVELAEGDGAVPKLKMVAYSGGVIKDHWYWDDLAIDLEGIQFKNSKFPVLEDHMTSKKIAVISKPIVEDGKLMAPENAKFLSTDASKEFQQLSQDGFPYQASIYAKPSNVERLEDGATAKVNGFTMKGPASIWRKCEFKEMSVCVFGADSKTRAAAFSRDEFEHSQFTESIIPAESLDGKNTKLNRRKEVKKPMNKEELLAAHPDVIKGIVDEAVASALSEAETKHSAETAKFSSQLEAMKTSNDQMSGKVLDLEKKDVIRAEEKLKDTADLIWTQKLGASNVPEHLWVKVSPHVTHAKFMEDGVFNEVKFGETIDAEIKDWEDKGVVSSVLGAGFTEKDPEGENKQSAAAADVKTDVDRLVEKAGGVPKQD